jgi:hypothetical protein
MLTRKNIVPLAGYQHVHAQDTPATSWTIPHNLGRRPNSLILSSGGMEMWAEVVHLSDNVLVVGFAVPTMGTAHLA